MENKQELVEIECPFCHLRTIHRNNVMHDMRRIEQMYSKLNELNYKCEDNMKRLNDMMLELKGVIGMVRASAKKNDWYKDEIQGKDDLDTPRNRLIRERKNNTLQIEIHNEG